MNKRIIMCISTVIILTGCQGWDLIKKEDDLRFYDNWLCEKPSIRNKKLLYSHTVRAEVRDDTFILWDKIRGLSPVNTKELLLVNDKRVQYRLPVKIIEQHVFYDHFYHRHIETVESQMNREQAEDFKKFLQMSPRVKILFVNDKTEFGPYDFTKKEWNACLDLLKYMLTRM